MPSIDGLARLRADLEEVSGSAAALDLAGFDGLAGAARREARGHARALRDSVDSLNRIVRQLDAMTSGVAATGCEQCGQRFYPLRGDARFCSSTCRSRGHRSHR